MSDVVLTVNGEQVADVECVGEAVDGFLFFTAPASYVVRGGFLVHDDCDTQNMEGLALFGTMDALCPSSTPTRPTRRPSPVTWT